MPTNTSSGLMLPKALIDRLPGSNAGTSSSDGIGWAPHPCYLCEGTGKISDATVGKEPKWINFVGKAIELYRDQTCPKCSGTGKGPQEKALTRTEFEILIGGMRGGGKTAAGIIFLVMGNPGQPMYKVMRDGSIVENPVNISYTNHPFYKALVLRKNQLDLDDWIDKADRIFSKLGARKIGSRGQVEFVFPSLARIITGHMADKDAYEKYQGQEYHRIVIEELTQIPTRKQYEMVRASCRVPEELRAAGIREQIMCTANPGGPGHGWVKKYFRIQELNNATGEFYMPEETIEEERYSEVARKLLTSYRVFVPAGIADNPSLDDAYIANLEGIEDEKVRRAWLYGDWNILAGVFFDNFRPNGPGYNEPANADHVIRVDPTGTRPGTVKHYPDLEPWWPRVMACDWGYGHDAAVYWGCRSPETKQLHIYRELVVSRTSPIDLGVAIAEASLQDLSMIPDQHMFLYLSHDAYANSQHVRGSVRSLAELIAEGIQRVLGDNSVHVPQLNLDPDDPAQFDFSERYEKWVVERKRVGRRSITIIRADTNRVLGFTNMRGMMNWTPPVSSSWVHYNQDVERMIYREKGVAAGQEYVHLTMPPEDGLFPRIQIWDTCPVLIDALPQAQHSETNPEDIDKTHFKGMDSIDAARYLCQGVRALEFVKHDFDTERLTKISEYKRLHPDHTYNDLLGLNYVLEAKEKMARRNQANFRTPRLARKLRHQINTINQSGRPPTKKGGVNWLM